MIEFSTARLIPRQPEQADAEPLVAMDAGPEVMRYIGTGEVITRDRDWAPRAIARWRQEWDERGFGRCSVIVRETGEYAG